MVKCMPTAARTPITGPRMNETPFTTIESAEEFMQLLHLETEKVVGEIQELLDADDGTSERRLQALRLVLHKLDQLRSNTSSSLRLLHDLRSLRTLLTKTL